MKIDAKYAQKNAPQRAVLKYPQKNYSGKPGRFLSDADYQRQLDRAIATFQAKVASPWRAMTGDNLHRIYAIFVAQHPQPLTRLQLAERVEPPQPHHGAAWVRLNFRLHSSLQNLHRTGFLSACGRVVQPRFSANSTHSSMAYRAVLHPDLCRHRQARMRLYATVAHLNELHAKGHRLLSVHSDDPREAAILKLRAAGRSLLHIAADFGVSRERIRQLLARALNRGSGRSACTTARNRRKRAPAVVVPRGATSPLRV